MYTGLIVESAHTNHAILKRVKKKTSDYTSKGAEWCYQHAGSSSKVVMSSQRTTRGSLCWTEFTTRIFWTDEMKSFEHHWFIYLFKSPEGCPPCCTFSDIKPCRVKYTQACFTQTKLFSYTAPLWSPLECHVNNAGTLIDGCGTFELLQTFKHNFLYTSGNTKLPPHLLSAFNISINTRTDNAMVIGLGSSKISQLIPSNLPSWARHCAWWVWEKKFELFFYH